MQMLKERVPGSVLGEPCERASEGESERVHLPARVARYLERSLPAEGALPAIVRVQQVGEMWKKPGARTMRFEATEDFAVNRVAFSWRARFPMAGPLGLTVVDEYANGDGQLLRLSLLGIPLQTQKGPKLAVGEAMRYLAELVWAPQAFAANSELEWGNVGQRRVEVATMVGASRVGLELYFDEAGDIVRVAGMRPCLIGRTCEPRPWGGDFGEYASFDGMRIPAFGQAWWDLPEGRFVYWRGRITGVELIGRRD